MSLSAGDLNRRVQIWRAITVDDGHGAKTKTWKLISTVWAQVVGISGREAVIGHALQGISVYRIIVRFAVDVTDVDQIRFGSTDLNIKSVIDPDGGRERLQILADTESVEAMPNG